MSTTKLAAVIEHFDSAALLAFVGALHLIPENAAHGVRLELLAHEACGGGGTNPLSHPELLAIWPKIAKGLEPWAHLEDPQEAAYVGELAFGDRVYRVLPGITQDNTFIVQHLLDALCDLGCASEDDALIRTVLGISEEIARRAALGRRSRGKSEPGAPIVLPDDQDLERLSRAVVFDESEVRLLVPAGMPATECFGPLLCRRESVMRGKADSHRGLLLSSPLVLLGGHVVCPAPSLLIGALRHALISRSVARGTSDKLAQGFHLRVCRTVMAALSRCGMDLFGGAPLGPGRKGTVSDAVLAFDRDKVAVVTVTTDPLTGYDHEAPFSEWHDMDWSQRIEQRVSARHDAILKLVPPPNALHEIHVLQGVGRDAAFAGPSSVHLAEVERLLMTAAELQLIASVDGGNPLVLWQYAGARERVRKSTEIMASSTVDAYGFYRRSDRSFYVSDGERPSLIVVMPGEAMSLVNELADQADEHLRLDPQTGRCVAVRRVHDGSPLSIYMHSWPEGQQLAIAVDGYPVPLWVIGINEFVGRDGRLRGFCEELVDALAYWLHEFAPRLGPHLASLRERPGTLEIGVQLEQTEAWLVADEEAMPTETEALVASKADCDAGIVMLAFRPPMSKCTASVDNDGERLLLAHTLRALVGALRPIGVAVSVDEIDAIIDWGAPRGSKRKLTQVDLHASPDLDSRGLRPQRSVQPSQVNAVLDELGDHLCSGLGLAVGAVAQDKAHPVLLDSVAFLFARLAQVVATISSEGLLEWLVGLHESTARRASQHRLTLHNRVAMFESEGKVLAKIRDELKEIGAVTFAGWFLVEYASAMPPQGLRRISLSVYDELMALAHLIIHFGWDCDVLKFELAELPIAIVPSRRLWVDRERLTEAQLTYLGRFAGDYVERARREAPMRLGGREVGANGPSTLLDEVDPIVMAEYGVSLSDILAVLGQCITWGLEGGSAVTIRAEQAFHEELAAALGWNQERVGSVTSLLTLQPREVFEQPGAGYRPYDTYPWRFERSFGYVRRPLVVRGVGVGREVMWGHRHMNRSAAHWAQTCFSGHGEHRSAEMRAWAGRQRNAEGQQFENEVGAACEDQLSGQVMQRVRKIAGRRLSLDGKDLGDIDVLASRLVPPTIYVIECKALHVARTPDRLQFEVNELFDRRPEAKSAVVKLERRVQWVRENLDVCAPFLGLVQDAEIDVVPMIVLDRELISPHLTRDVVRAVALPRLGDVLGAS